jgi:hypothetical protein
MFFNPKFFYTDNVSEGGAAAEVSTQTDTPAIVEKATETTPDTPPAIPQDVLKELEDLRAFKKTVSESQSKTAEQLQKEADIEKAELIKYSAENNLMKVDDFSRYETSKQRQDRELVFENFSKEWKEDNKDATDEDVTEAFDYAFHLSSENEKLKAKGEKLIAKEAKELRQPLETSYNNAKERYTGEKQLRADYPNFQKYLTEAINSSLPDKIKVGEREIGEENAKEKVAIDIDLTKDEKKEIFDAVQKELSKPEVFLIWKEQTKDGKNEMLQKMVTKESKYLINEKKQAVVFEKTADEFYARGKTIGTKSGSTVGATNPFAMVKNKGFQNPQPVKDAHTIVSKADMELRQKINGRGVKA